MRAIRAIGTASPAGRVPQDKLRELARSVLDERDPALLRVLSVFDHAGVEERALAMPIEWYLARHGHKDRAEAFARQGLELAHRAATQALDRAGLDPDRLGGVVFVTTTGVAAPSLDARLANALGCRPDVARLPIWGLGCAGGVAGLNRAVEVRPPRPGAPILLVALELCSLAFDLSRFDKKTLVAASLFSDGCAAVVLADDGGPRHIRGASHLVPATERVMGWDVEDATLDVVFSTSIPSLVEREAPRLVRAFLAGSVADRHVLHPGGSKVLRAYETGLGLPPPALDEAQATLARHGNMSSATVLYVLERSLARAPLAPGETALLAAMGPGFSVDLALLEG